jgi:hypothetical protein
LQSDKAKQNAGIFFKQEGVLMPKRTKISAIFALIFTLFASVVIGSCSSYTDMETKDIIDEPSHNFDFELLRHTVNPNCEYSVALSLKGDVETAIAFVNFYTAPNGFLEGLEPVHISFEQSPAEDWHVSMTFICIDCILSISGGVANSIL